MTRTKATASTTANPERGEHKVVLAGATYKLRPTYTAMKTIELETNRSIVELARAGSAQAINLSQAAVICGELIRAGAEDELTAAVDNDRIGELIYEEGLAAVVVRLTVCLLDAAKGGRKATGEAQAPVA